MDVPHPWRSVPWEAPHVSDSCTCDGLDPAKPNIECAVMLNICFRTEHMLIGPRQFKGTTSSHSTQYLCTSPSRSGHFLDAARLRNA